MLSPALPVLHCLRDELLQYPEVDICQLVDVEAALPGLVSAELLEEIGGLVVAAEREIQNRIVFARRETHYHPVEHSAAVIDDFPGSKADDRLAPHFRGLAGDLREQIADRDGVVAPVLIADTRQKFLDACIGALCLELGHSVIPFCAGEVGLPAFRLENNAPRPVTTGARTSGARYINV